MWSFNINTLFLCPLVLLPLTLPSQAQAQNKDIDEARLVMKMFGGELKSVLQTVMATDGPIKALEVCNLQAGPITKKNSMSSDWKVSRTSLKVRNINNEPDEWEVIALQEFEKRKSAGEDIAKMEYSEIINNENNMVLRYIKPIPTTEVCITCHGGKISDELSKTITKLYPYDKATGFNMGDIRGAFSLEKTLPRTN